MNGNASGHRVNQHSSNISSLSPGIAQSDYNNLHLENQNLPTHNDRTVAQASLATQLSPTVMFSNELGNNSNGNSNSNNQSNVSRNGKTSRFNGFNEYSPHNMLPKTTFHRRVDNHSRSYTSAHVPFSNPSVLIDKPPTSHRRTVKCL